MFYLGILWHIEQDYILLLGTGLFGTVECCFTRFNPPKKAIQMGRGRETGVDVAYWWLVGNKGISHVETVHGSYSLITY